MSERRRVWAETDLSALRENYARARRSLPTGCGITGVVKADAYGHGAEVVSRALEELGIDQLAVGDADEAVTLREAGILTPILVLGASLEAEIPALVEARVIPSIHSPDRIAHFAREAQRAGVRLAVHLFVDTGMSRLGVNPENALEHLRAIAAEPSLVLVGLGTHLASPEQELWSREQLARFDGVLFAARSAGLLPPRVHVASSLPLDRYPESSHDMVRLGGALYGLHPDPSRLGPDAGRPVLSLRTQVIHVRDLPSGAPVGYGGTFVTRRPTRLATLPVGYHDGFPHSLSNRGQVLIRGARAPVVGRVSMDYVTIDVTEVPEAATGDTVTILGEDGGDRIHAAELAAWAGTVCYEIPSRLGPRVARVVRDDRSPPRSAVPPAGERRFERHRGRTAAGAAGETGEEITSG